MSEKRRRFSVKYEWQAVRLAVESSRAVTEVAREVDVLPDQAACADNDPQNPGRCFDRALGAERAPPLSRCTPRQLPRLIASDPETAEALLEGKNPP